ncbi:MAG: SPFH domain-containing protein [Clostridiales bacterium]|jgi:regulator of protease activity HflC (stomatin/prohibitin superfamily)|nr:SPFH domain-containing protein [Clostridiales bacterium]
MENEKRDLVYEEKKVKAVNGLFMLIMNILLIFLSFGGIVFGIINSVAIVVISGIALIVLLIMFGGYCVLKPNEAYVFTLFGKYYGTLTGPGFFFVNPFVSAFNPSTKSSTTGAFGLEINSASSSQPSASLHVAGTGSKKISLKAMTLNNDKQKINDQLGNPIIIGIVVIWKVANTAKAVFNVDNFTEYLSIQCDSALRNIVRMYPYDVSGDNEKTLRASSQEISENLREEIQKKVDIAGLEIIEATITNLSYAPEIASAMLQRQQASAVVDARQMIVEGAVGMVEMALAKLSEHEIVQLDEERKAAMVSNLLVVLCGNKEAQPVVNSGSIY